MLSDKQIKELKKMINENQEDNLQYENEEYDYIKGSHDAYEVVLNAIDKLELENNKTLKISRDLSKTREMAINYIQLLIINQYTYDKNDVDEMAHILKSDLKACFNVFKLTRPDADNELKEKLFNIIIKDKNTFEKLLKYLSEGKGSTLNDNSFETLFHLIYDKYPEFKFYLYQIINTRGYKVKLTRIESLHEHKDEINAGKLITELHKNDK